MPDDVSPSPTTAYPIGPRNRLRRRSDRGHYDRAAIWAVLDAAMVATVAFVVDGEPVAVPTIHWREGDDLYWHGAGSSRMLRSIVDRRVCVTVSHLDRLVLARSAFDHSVDYRSAMCFGTARLVDDPVERRAALDAMVDRYWPGRAAELRPMRDAELAATAVIRMRIEEASAKLRTAGFVDVDEDLATPVWAGAIPLRTVIGELAPSTRGTMPASPPAHLAAYRSGRELGEALAETARTASAAEED